LRGLGRILRETTRASDIIGRFGGEEFLMLMPGVTVEVAAQRAQQVLDAVHRMQVTLPTAMLDGVTLSIGLAVMPVHVAEGDDLLAAADAALYEAKREGRNRVVVSHRRAKADTAA
jgi:diguanylate cyclase (GGDEF)-like protein